MTEICFDEALDQARELDAFQEEHGRLKGPLHGVPVSLKDQFNLEGLDSTLGYVGRAFSPANADCVLVQVLKRLGAVIIAKTNLPQSILVWEYIIAISQTHILIDGSGAKRKIRFGA